MIKESEKGIQTEEDIHFVSNKGRWQCCKGKMTYLKEKMYQVYENYFKTVPRFLSKFKHFDYKISFTLILIILIVSFLLLFKLYSIEPYLTPGMTMKQAKANYEKWVVMHGEIQDMWIGIQSYIRLKEINQVNFFERNEILEKDKNEGHKNYIDTMTQLNIILKYKPILKIDAKKHKDLINELVGQMEFYQVTQIEELIIEESDKINDKVNFTLTTLDEVKIIQFSCSNARLNTNPLMPVFDKVVNSLRLNNCNFEMKDFSQMLNSLKKVKKIYMNFLAIEDLNKEENWLLLDKDALQNLSSLTLECYSNAKNNEQYICHTKTLSHLIESICQTEAQKTLERLEINWNMVNSAEIGSMIYQSICKERLKVHWF
jgi:hypothetical protein